MSSLSRQFDWSGNKKSIFVTLGAKGHSENSREEHDFYATDPNSLEIFLDALERDKIELSPLVWECACGQGHLSEVLKNRGYKVLSTDLINRKYIRQDDVVDFLETTHIPNGCVNADILTNPPYKYAKEFVERALDLVEDDRYVVMFLKVQFLEGKNRRELFNQRPPRYVYINSSRQTCYLNGDMSHKMSSATCYCWFVWQKGFKGEPVIRWV